MMVVREKESLDGVKMTRGLSIEFCPLFWDLLFKLDKVQRHPLSSRFGE
jgi:hypothetical protein